MPDASGSDTNGNSIVDPWELAAQPTTTTTTVAPITTAPPTTAPAQLPATGAGTGELAGVAAALMASGAAALAVGPRRLASR